MSNLIKQSNTEMDSIKIIKESGILTKDDLQSLQLLSKENALDFMRVQTFRTGTEMRISVLNDLKHPTVDSKYWQSIRESNVMYTETINLSYEYRKKLVELKKLERRLTTEKDDLELELLIIEVDQCKWGLLNMEKTAKARIGELNEWSVIKEELEKDLEFSEQDVDEHQLMSYTARFINQYNVKGTSGSPSENANLVGQMESCIRQLHKKGITNKFLNLFGDSANEVAAFCSTYIPIDEKYLPPKKEEQLEELLREDPANFLNEKV